jgi:hypothetical protein
MESSFKIIVLITVFFICQNSFCQSDKAFCNAVEHLKFNKVERIFNRQVNKLAEGYVYANQDSGWGNATSYNTHYTTLINWLKKQDCVIDAFWDKCQAKAAIYPGYSSIGVKFKTKNGVVEKCFLIQEGTTGQVNILGWKPKLCKSKNKLVYKKIFDCKNFIEQQKTNCKGVK